MGGHSVSPDENFLNIEGHSVSQNENFLTMEGHSVSPTENFLNISDGGGFGDGWDPVSGGRYSRKLLYCASKARSAALSIFMALCRSSRFFPVMRTVSS